MKKILISLLALTSLTFAFDMAGIAESVDKQKATDSVDTEKAMAAAAKGTDIEMKDVTDSVDTDKAVESVDKAKLVKSFF